MDRKTLIKLKEMHEKQIAMINELLGVKKEAPKLTKKQQDELRIQRLMSRSKYS